MTWDVNKKRNELRRERRNLIKTLNDIMDSGGDDPGDITPDILEIDEMLKDISKIQQKKNKKWMT